MELDGKRTLMTGGARVSVAAIATLFTERGAKVAIADIDGEAAEKRGGRTRLRRDRFACDVTKPAEVQGAIDQTVEAFGGMDIIVNNAGIEIGKPLPEITDEEFDLLMASTSTASSTASSTRRPLWPLSQAAILNMSSVAGLAGVPLLGAYCASKAAVLRLTQTAAIELRDYGIRVNAICPSFIETEMVERLVAPFEAATGAEFDDLAAQAQARLGTAEEVAETVAFLASDDAIVHHRLPIRP